MSNPDVSDSPQTPAASTPASGSVASWCQMCGERIAGQVWEWKSYKALCGLCADDLMNADFKARHDTAMQETKPQNS